MARRRFHEPLHCASRDSTSRCDRVCFHALYGNAQTPLKASGARGEGYIRSWLGRPGFRQAGPPEVEMKVTIRVDIVMDYVRLRWPSRRSTRS